jgi:hypothetical protein
MSLEDDRVEEGGQASGRPLRRLDLWRVFLPVYPWVVIVLVIYFVVRRFGQPEKKRGRSELVVKVECPVCSVLAC